MDPPCVCPVSRVWCMEDAITGMPADCCEKLWIDGIPLDHMPHGWEDEYKKWEYYIKDDCFWLKDNTWENEDNVIVGGLSEVVRGQGDGRAGMDVDESVHAHGSNVGNNYTNNSNNFTQDTQLTDNTNTSFGGLLGRDLSKIFIELPQKSIFAAAATFISMSGYGNESIRETLYTASQIETETLKCLEKLRNEQMASELDLCLENISSVYENDPSQQNVDFDEDEVKALIKSSYYEYSITQALADATGITIWLRDTTSGVRYIITPNTKSIISSPMNIACDLIDHKEEEKGLFALEEETSRMDMSEGGKSEGGMNSSSDEEFDGDNMDEDSESGSNDSVALAPTHVTQEIECGNVGDIFSPSSILDTSKFEQQFGIRARVRVKKSGINSVVVSGKEEDVDKAANYLITHHHGKSKNRIEEVDKGKEYTLLVHNMSPEAIMIATDEVEVPSVLTQYEFWKQKDRDDLLISDLSILRLYQVQIICKDGDVSFQCSGTLNHPFTKLEGSVALLRAQKVLGKPQAKYGHTYNLSNMNKGQVRDMLAKAGFFAGEYNTAASNEMRSDRLKWGSCLDNPTDSELRDTLYKDTRNEMARKAKEWAKSQGQTQNLNNPNSSNVGDVFLSDIEVQQLGLTEFSKTKPGPCIEKYGRPVYHTGHNSITQGSHCFFNKHDVEAKPVPFWPGVLGWYNSLGLKLIVAKAVHV